MIKKEMDSKGHMASITKEREALETLSYREVMDSLSHPALLLTSLHRVLDMNKAFTTFLGYQTADVLGISYLSLVSPNDQLQAQEELLAYEKDKSYRSSFLHQLQHKNGSFQLVVASIQPLTFTAKEALFLLLFSSPLEETFQGLLKNVCSPIMLLNPKGEVLFWSFFAEEILGHREEDVVNRKAETFLLSQGDYRLFQEALAASLQKGIERKGEERLDLDAFHRDGSIISLSLSLYALKIGSQWHILALLRPAAMEKSREKDLGSFDLHWLTLLEQLPEGIMVADQRSQSFHFVNPTMCQMLGYSRQELIGLSPSDIHPKEELPRVAQEFSKMASGEISTSLDILFQRKDGTTFPADVNAVQLELNGRPYLLGVFNDITERRESQEKILQEKERAQKSEQLLKEAQRIAQLGYWELDLIKNHLHWSDEVFAIFGCAPQEFKATYEAFLQFIHPDDREKVNEAYSQHLKTKEEYDIIHRILTREGEVKYVHERCVSTFDHQGRPLRSLGVVVDITHIREAQERLRQNEAFLSSIVATQQEMICRFLPDTTLTFVNKRYCEAFGLSEEELLGSKFLQFLHPEERGPLLQGIEELCATKTTKTFAPQRVQIHEDVIWQQWTNTVILDEEGEVVELQSTGYDITERKKALDALQESEEQLRLITSNLQDVILETDRQGYYTYLSPSHQRVLGRGQELLGSHFAEFVHLEDATKANLLLNEAIELGSSRERREYRYLHPKEGYIWVESIAKTYKKTNGDLFALITTRNISERKQAEQDRIARQAAEKANQAKSIFLSNMSHEIRTPLNAIIGFAQILKQDSSLSAKQMDQVHTIARSGEHLLKLINDILDFSRIEAGRLNVSYTSFNLHDLLEDLEMMFRFRAEMKGLQFLMERQESVPRYVKADEGKLRQVLINLVGNAIKFTKEGGVALRIRADVSLSHAHKRKEEQRLFVEVEDTGPGIEEKDLESIFFTFQQTERGNEIGGTGLGLSISKRLVELMGGRITIESRVGKGSCFRFDVPFEPAEGEKKKKKLANTIVGLEMQGEPCRILIVDDQMDNRKLLRSMLEPFGFEMREAINGEEALLVFEAWSPHLVLMDMRMPIMDGYEATRQIKATAKGKKIPVVAVTASAFEDEEKDVLATGVENYLRKPFRQEDLFRVIGELLNLCYIYEKKVKEKGSKRASLKREDIAALPEDLIFGLQKAVEEGEMAKLKELILQVERIDEKIAAGLQLLAKEYDYESLSKLLD